MARGNAIRAGRAFVELFAEARPLVRGLRGAEKQLNSYGRNVARIGAQTLAAATVAAAPLALSTKVFAGFEDEMLTVASVTAATERQMQSMTGVAKELGRTISYTAREVASGMTALGRAGFSTDEIEAAIPSVLTLARATRVDLASAAEYTTDVMRAFGLQAQDTTRIADILTATANSSSQNVTQLAEAMSYAAPFAAEAGVDLRETAKAIGVMANMGIKGSMAGTALRQTLLQLANTGVQDKLREIGVTATTATGEFRPLGDIMLDLGKAMAAMPNAKRLGLTGELFGARAAGGALKLTGATVESMQKLADALADVDGTAARTAKTMDSGLGGAWRMMMSAVEAVSIAIGEALAPTLKQIAGAVQRVAEATAKWIDKNRAVIVAAAMILVKVAAIGASLVVLGALLKAAGIAFGVMAAVVSALFSPLGVLTVVVVALGHAILTQTEAGGKALAWLGGQFAALKDRALATFGGIADALRAGDMGLAARVLWNLLKMEWVRGTNAVKELWYEFWGGMQKAAADGWYGALFMARKVWDMLASGWDKATDGLLNAWDRFVTGIMVGWEHVKASAAKAWNYVKGLWEDGFDVAAANAAVDAAREVATSGIRAYGSPEADERRRQSDAAGVAREAELQRLAREWLGVIDAIDEETAGKVQGLTERLDAARKEWQESIDTAREAREYRDLVANSIGNEYAKAGMTGAGGDGAGGSLAAAIAGAAGTFNVSNLLGLAGGGKAAERTARAAEETARNTSRIIQAIEDSEPAFA